ncbi:hypothetical protein Tco_0252115 [Tanacetum coccineum]
MGPLEKCVTPTGLLQLLNLIVTLKGLSGFVEDDHPELELKDLPPHLEYAFLEGTSKLPVIITKDLKREEKDQLIKVPNSHKRAIAWKISDIRGIDPSFCTHKILMKDDFKPVVQHQKRVNPKIHEVIKAEVIKLLDARLIYHISDSPWVSHVHVVPKKGGMTVVTNDNNKLIPTRLVTRWRVCIDYQKLNDATRKDHFLLPFMDQMLEHLVGMNYNVFLMVILGISKFLSIPKTKKKPPSPALVGHLLIVGCLSVFAMPQELFKGSHFMVKWDILLNHKISKYGIQVDKAKVDVIAKLPPPTTIKGIRRFLEFNIEIRDKKRAGNLAADHLTRLENPHKEDLVEIEMNDNFPHEICANQIIRRCMDGKEAMDILEACHHGPTGGHHGPNVGNPISPSLHHGDQEKIDEEKR